MIILIRLLNYGSLTFFLRWRVEHNQTDHIQCINEYKWNAITFGHFIFGANKRIQTKHNRSHD